MADDVRLSIGADISSLQKGVKQATKEIDSLAKSAKDATAPANALAGGVDNAGRAMQSVGASSNRARLALTDLNRVASDAPFGFIAIQNNIDPLIGSFSRLIQESGGVKGAIKALGASLGGPAGFLTLISFASSAAIVFGDEISAAFNKGAKAAKESKAAFSDAVESLLTIDIGGKNFDISSIEELRSAVSAARSNVDQLTKAFDAAKAASAGSVVSFKNDPEFFRSGGAAAAEQRKKAAEDTLNKERQILTTFEQQLIKAEAIVEARKRLSALGLGSNVDLASGLPAIDGQDIEAAYNLQQISEDFVAVRQDQIRANIETADSFKQVTAALEREAEAAISEIQIADQRIQNSDLETDSTMRRSAAMAQFQTSTINAGGAFVELGAQGVGALASIALGFEKVQGAADVVSTIVKQLVVQLAAAAAKAAILSFLFPGAGAAAGGFKGLFKLGLGIPALANGGVVTKPTLSLIGEAGPEAVVPLSKLSSVGGGQSVHIPNVTIRGGDLVIAFQQARKSTARNLGNIPLQ